MKKIKIILAYDLYVDEDADFDAIYEDIESNDESIYISSVEETANLSSVHIAQKGYLIQADNNYKVGTCN